MPNRSRSSETLLRRAEPADAERMAALQLRTALVAYAGIFPETARKPEFAELREWWDQRLGQPPPAAAFVAERGGEVVGTVWVGPYHEDARVGLLSRLYVAPELWGSGLGSVLYDRALEALNEADFPEAVLGVLELNERAREFYERRGWRPDGTSYEAGTGTGVIEMLYRLPLPRA